MFPDRLRMSTCRRGIRAAIKTLDTRLCDRGMVVLRRGGLSRLREHLSIQQTLQYIEIFLRSTVSCVS